jgi:sn-glycerol 3-phosphate transport system substrate-binding protein
MRSILSIILLCSFLAACAPTQSNETSKGAEPIELVYWHTLPGPAGKAQDDLVAKFNASQNRIHVTSEFQGSFYTELETKVLTAYTTKSTSDISQLGTYEIREFARSGVLLDLKPFIQGADGLDTADWKEDILAAGKVDNGIYWLPFNIAVPVLYYNKEAFQESGIIAPPATWEEFFSDARMLTKRDANGVVQRYGAAYWDMSWPMLSAIWSEGGELTSRDLKIITLDDPAAVDVLSKFQALLKEGAAVLPDKASGGHRTVFKNGKAAMILDSPSPFSDIYAQSLGFTPGVANYPAGKKGRVYAPGAGGLVMISTTPPEKRQAAWTFIKFMLSAQNLADYSRQTSYVAFYPSAQKHLGDLLKDERYATIYAALPDVRWDFTLYWAPPVRNAFERAWQKIFFDLADVQKTLKAANEKAGKK